MDIFAKIITLGLKRFDISNNNTKYFILSMYIKNSTIFHIPANKPFLTVIKDILLAFIIFCNNSICSYVLKKEKVIKLKLVI